MLITKIAVFLQGSVYHLLQTHGDVGIESRRGYRIAIEDGFSDEAGTASWKRQPPRRHLIENDTERKQIRAGVQHLGPYLLGRHVGYGSQSGTGAGKMFLGDVGERLRRLRRDL